MGKGAHGEWVKGLEAELFATDGAEAVGTEGEAGGIAVGGDGGGVARGIDERGGVGVEIAFDDHRATELAGGLSLGGFEDEGGGAGIGGEGLDAEMDGVGIGAGGESGVDVGIGAFEGVVARETMSGPEGSEFGVESGEAGVGGEAGTDVGFHGGGEIGKGGDIGGDEGDIADFRGGDEGAILVEAIGDLFEGIGEIDGASGDHPVTAEAGILVFAVGAHGFVIGDIRVPEDVLLVGVDGGDFD